MKFKVGEMTRDWADRSQIPVWYAAQTHSTNTVAKDNLLEPAPVTLYVADHQTAGRGRNENVWVDPQEGGEALLTSWVFMMRKSPQPILSPMIGLALWRTFAASFPALSWSLKAPNDLYLGERKVAGLLIENVQAGTHHRLIVGLGVNIWKSPAAVETATCLDQHAPQELTAEIWMGVLDRLLLEMSLAVSQTQSELNLNQRTSLLAALNRFPHLNQAYQKVDPDGSLWKAEQKINWSEL